MCFSSPSVPSAPAPQQVATAQDPAVVASMERERRRAAMSQGIKSTMLTGGSGLKSPGQVSMKSLLGE